MINKWTDLCHNAVGCGACHNGEAKSEEKGEASVELDHDDSNVNNECEDANDSDDGGKMGRGNDTVEGSQIIYPRGWRMTRRMMS